jgi:hypothetical protein
VLGRRLRLRARPPEDHVEPRAVVALGEPGGQQAGKGPLQCLDHRRPLGEHLRLGTVPDRERSQLEYGLHRLSNVCDS